MVNEYLGKDIMISDGDIVFSTNQDFAVRSDEDNLRQAIINRLNTIKGEYYYINYGSNINNIYGKNKDDLLLAELKGYIIEALLQEVRIDSIETVNLNYNDTKDEVECDISVLPINSDVVLNLIYPVFLNEGS